MHDPGTHLPATTAPCRLDRLYDQAVARYGARCLWYIRPDRSPAGLAAIAEALRRHGDLAAWRLAAEIRNALRESAGDAPR